MTSAEIWVQLAAGLAVSSPYPGADIIAARTDALFKEFEDRFQFDDSSGPTWHPEWVERTSPEGIEEK